MIVVDFKIGPNAGQRIGLDKTTILVGNKGCDLVIIDPAVTGPHCKIAKDGEAYTIMDLGSPSGTRVGAPNAPPLPANTLIRLMPGQVVYIGQAAVSFGHTGFGEEVTTKPKARRTSAWQRAGDTMQVRGKAQADDPDTTAPMAPDSLPPTPAASRPPTPAASPVASAPSSPPVARRMSSAGKGRSQSVPGNREFVVIEPLPEGEDPAEVYADYEGQSNLVFIDGPHVGRRVFLADNSVTMGRGEANDIVLYDDKVAVHHCQIEVVGGGNGYAIVALSRHRPIKVNSDPVTERSSLRNGDIISIGGSDMRFVDGSFKETEDEADAHATIAAQESMYSFYGTVKKAKVLTIGRSPDSDLFLYHHAVERNHARVYFQFPSFYIQDQSSEGIYVNGERVTEQKIGDNDVATVGGFTIRFDIQALRCGLDITPPAGDEDDIPSFAADLESSSFQTMYRVPTKEEGGPVGPEAKLKPKERKNRKSVLWVEPGDVKRNWRVPLMVFVAVVTTMGVTLALAREGGNSFLRRPLAPSHRSATFKLQVQNKFEQADACTSCHGAFTGPVTDACITCHELEKNGLRAPHAKVATLSAELCTSCHSEHFQEFGAPHLVVGENCANEACHPKRHEKFFPAEKGPKVQQPGLRATFMNRRREFGVDLKADLAFTQQDRYEVIHTIHESLDGYCVGCHATADGQKRPEGTAYRACFTCHGPKSAEEALGSTECSACHREHGPKAKWAEVRMGPGEVPAKGKTSAVFFLLLAPPVLFAFHNLVTGRRRKSQAVDDSMLEEGPMLCDGVELAKATRLPRLTPSKCTGSTLCVGACPYGVLEMRPGKPPKPVVAKPELCHECTTCVQVCGPGALTMMVPGEPFPMVDRPSVDANYETSVDGSDGGVYVIGEAGAKPSVKNSINLGYWTIEHVLFKGVTPNACDSKGADYDVVVCGSGPAGISTGLTAHERGLKYVIFEKKDEFAQTIRSYPKGKLLQVNPPPPEDPQNPEAGEVTKQGRLWLERDTTREEALEKWAPEVAHLNIEYQQTIKGIKHADGVFEISTNKGKVKTLRIVLAPGVRGDPRKLGKPGDDLPKVAYSLDDPKNYEGKSCMVVGGGNSAVEAAIALATVNENCKVAIVYRKKNFSRATPKNRETIQSLIDSGKITAYLEMNVAEVRETTVLLDKDDLEVPNEALFTMLGAHAPTAWLKKLGIQLTKKSADWEPGPSDQPAFMQLAGDNNTTELGGVS